MKKTLLVTLLMAFSAMISFSQWSDNPSENLKVVNLTNEQTLTKVAVGPTGDYYVGFFSMEAGNYNVRLQRLDSGGNLLWADEGLLISEHESMSWLTDWDMTVDHENHAVLTWQDIRSGGNNNVVAYRISPEGEFIWGADGIMLSESDAFDVAPKVTITQSNNAVFAWQSTNDIIRQKVSPEGVKQWGEWGITMSGTNSYTWPQLLPVGPDDVVMKFYEDSGTTWAPIRHLKAQRFDENGQEAWASETIITDEGNIQAWHQILSFIPDGNHGFYIAWHDYTLSGTQASAWIQHVNESGEPRFAANGALLSNRISYNQFNPHIARPAGSEDAFVYWTEVNGDQNQWGIYGQRLNSQGDILWGEEGKEIYAPGSDTYNLFRVLDTEEDVVIIYDKNHHLYASRLNENGEFAWSEEHVLLTNASEGGTHPEVTEIFNNQWVFAWEDNRTDTLNIYAQNLFPDGTLGEENTQPDSYEVTFNVDLSMMEEYFNPDQDTIYLSGSMSEWAEPGTQPDTQMLTRADTTMIWTLTLELEEGEYEYKYFLNQGWSGGEWHGGDNRALVVNDNINLEDSWSPSNIHILQLEAQPEDGGTMDGEGTYHANAGVTLSAQAAENYEFGHWADGEEEASTDWVYTFNMPGEDLVLTAVFNLINKAGFLSSEKLTLYPNPTHNSFAIHSSTLIQNIEILDLTGRRVFQSAGGDTRITIHTSLPRGLYLVKVYTENGTGVRKLQIR